MKRLFTLLLTACLGSIAARAQPWQLVDAYPRLPNLSNCIELMPMPDGSNRMAAVLQAGRILFFDDTSTASTTTPFLDLTGVVRSGGELGLLGLAFHPGYPRTPYIYVHYTVDSSGTRKSRLTRWTLDPTNPSRLLPGSELRLLNVRQPYDNHNGGRIEFGPDGYLYISFGDGGSANDPQNLAQNTTSFLGKILRLDVDNQANGQNYAIPADNPFRDSTRYKPEIYALGLRNVWKFAWDVPANRLVAADVGQNAIEEIDLITSGGNYGWKPREGTRCAVAAQCNNPRFIPPVFEYSQSNGDRSITGGLVYRGNGLPSLAGRYIYGDYVSRNIWALNLDVSPVTNTFVVRAPASIATFGLSNRNEMLVGGYANNGRIYRLTDLSVGLPSRLTQVQNLRLAPNPARGELTLHLQNRQAGNAQIRLFNALGEEISGKAQALTLLPGTQTHTLSLAGLAPGVYLLQVQEGQGLIAQRLVVE